MLIPPPQFTTLNTHDQAQVYNTGRDHTNLSIGDTYHIYKYCVCCPPSHLDHGRKCYILMKCFVVLGR